MRIRPKHIAACDFIVAGHKFTTGDAVDGVALAAVLPFGDRFVTTESRRSKKSADATQAEVSTPTPTEESQ